jgi:phosphatidylglycerol:prolipoprotein diacylglycerol transferase
VTRGDAGLTIVFDFDPYLRLGEFAVRLETLGVAAAIFVGMVLAALVAARTPGHDLLIGDAEPRADDGDGPWHLRRDDLLFIALGAVPGAVLLGRLGYGLLHADFYATEWRALLDPRQGSLELTLGVVGGTATAIYVASLVGAPVARWLHVAIVPLLAALGLGKVAQALGGSGQGAASDGLATAYLPPGPWGSPGADIPAHPSQLYEAASTLAVLLVVVLLARFTPLRRADGRLFAVGICLWALGRALVASTWRDPDVIAGLNAGQLMALAVAAAAIGAAAVATQRRDGSAAEPGPREA